MRVKKPFGNIQEVANFFCFKHPVFSRRLCYTPVTEKSKLSKSSCNNFFAKRRTLAHCSLEVLPIDFIVTRLPFAISKKYLTVIPRARIGSESIAYEAEGRMGY